jgi:multimeric flavodoxin WrbA
VIGRGGRRIEGGGDEWPALREKIVAADILVMATPTWIGSRPA